MHLTLPALGTDRPSARALAMLYSGTTTMTFFVHTVPLSNWVVPKTPEMDDAFCAGALNLIQIKNSIPKS
jgi:hypothetical protein